MSSVTVSSFTQKIVVDPADSSVSVINAGPIGPRGLDGPEGDQGEQGDVGPQGNAGTNGTNGTNGTQGIQGIPGPNVPQFAQDTPPTALVVGDQWFNTSNGRQYVWYDGFWIELGSSFIAQSNVLNADGQLLTRIGGVLAPVTRAVLAADPAFDIHSRGIVAYKRGNVAGVALNTTTPVAVYTLSANLIAGRMYELKFTFRALSSPGYINFSATVTPALADGLGAGQVDIYAYAPTAYATATWLSLLKPTVTQSYAITILGRTSSGTGGAWTDGGGGIWINDIGLAVAAS